MDEFNRLGLEDRVLKGIRSVGWVTPTPIQTAIVNCVLQGKDVLARGRTGSGKTGAFAIPIIHNILINKRKDSSPFIRAVVLAPSRELCRQCTKAIKSLASPCSSTVRCCDIAQDQSSDQIRGLLNNLPDVVVATPSSFLTQLKGEGDVFAKLTMLVIDEADLVFSHGFEDDIKSIAKLLPQGIQSVLLSATMTDEVKAMKRLFLHNPAIVKLNEPSLPSVNLLEHYHLLCSEEDKYILIVSLLKLSLVRGKTLIFVNTVPKAYKLKLLLHQFGLSACVLNSELPARSRQHAVDEFNNGKFEYVIATDDHLLERPQDRPKPAKKRRVKGSGEFSVSRGIDFQHIANVVNFDFPQSVDHYVHRAGRTARCGKRGNALSFVNEKEKTMLSEVETALHEQLSGDVLKPFQFRMEEVEGFRYRVRDALRAITKTMIRDVRFREIRAELMNCEKLKSYFDSNPTDLKLLKHDKNHISKLPSHVKDVPEYLVPKALRTVVPPRKQRLEKSKWDKRRPEHRKRDAKSRYVAKQRDPLQSFKFERRKRKHDGS